MRAVTLSLALAMAGLASIAETAVRQCQASHCGGADAEINEICKGEGWPVGHPVLTRDSIGPCTCTCSCLALGTPVEARPGLFRAVEEFAVGDEVLAAGQDLKWQPVKVAFSQGTTGNSRQPFSVFLTYGDRALIVTADHLFLMSDGTLKRADRLATTDSLALAAGGAVRVSDVRIGDYYGGFHHVATSTSPPTHGLANHLLNTNGVVSADYAVQLFHSEGANATGATAAMLSLPIVGTPEHDAKYPKPARQDKFLSRDLVVSEGNTEARSTITSLALPAGVNAIFVPAEKAGVQIPASAHPFLSEQDSKKLSTAPKRAFSDPLAQQWANYLSQFYGAFYPDVVYHVDWYNNTVNAYAWVEGGVRHVALLGGLIRTEALELEGIALILAHELGHHYGGAPTYPDGLSCEGQADFFGARNVMRKVWFGESYLSTMTKAITQLENFFGFAPGLVGAPAAGCTHPPGSCRIDTYNRAVELKPKPDCAK